MYEKQFCASQHYLFPFCAAKVRRLDETTAILMLKNIRIAVFLDFCQVYPTWLPGFTSLVVVTTLRLSSKSTAERIMP